MEILTPCPARVIHPSLNPPGFKSRNEEHRVQLWFKVLSGKFAPLANGGKQTQTNKPQLLWHSSKRLECLWWGSSLQVVGSVGPGPAWVGAAATRFGLFPFTIPLETKDRGKKRGKKGNGEEHGGVGEGPSLHLHVSRERAGPRLLVIAQTTLECGQKAADISSHLPQSWSEPSSILEPRFGVFQLGSAAPNPPSPPLSPKAPLTPPRGHEGCN